MKYANAVEHHRANVISRCYNDLQYASLHAGLRVSFMQGQLSMLTLGGCMGAAGVLSHPVIWCRKTASRKHNKKLWCVCAVHWSLASSNVWSHFACYNNTSCMHLCIKRLGSLQMHFPAGDCVPVLCQTESQSWRIFSNFCNVLTSVTYLPQHTYLNLNCDLFLKLTK